MYHQCVAEYMYTCSWLGTLVRQHGLSNELCKDAHRYATSRKQTCISTCGVLKLTDEDGDTDSIDVGEYQTQNHLKQYDRDPHVYSKSNDIM